MTDHTAAAPRAATAPLRPERKLRSYVRLGKLDVYDYYLSAAVVLTAALPAVRHSAPAAWTCAAFLAGEILVIVALVAFDDLTGFLDGSDIVNYGPDDPLRKRLRKPLVAGTLTPREALRFGWAALVLGAVVWAATVAGAPHRPVWALTVTGLLLVVSPQYSYGLKISYHGFQEAYIALLGVGLVIAPYGLATGEFSPFVLVQAVLFGLGPLMFGVYSNTNDIEGDRSVHRPTVAALATPRGNALFVGALSAGEFLLGALASATGVAPRWFVLLMLPVTALRTRQYVRGFRHGDIMSARRTGFAVHRLSVVLLVAANLLTARGAA
jgi:1,4-dihydroxy-2-naphthoate octaprenyltransferase